ncbi:MAG: hypothetical protein VYE73_00980 [Acidobacteriota bacterium]|nr:hypothetical protein [Acidobacteriota bacterium]
MLPGTLLEKGGQPSTERLHDLVFVSEHADPALLPIWSFRVVMGLHKRLRGIELSGSGPYGLAGKAPAGWPSPIGPGWWVRADERLER